MKTIKATLVLSLLLLSVKGATDPLEDIPNGSETANQPPVFWGIGAQAVQKWQSYLAEPDATGTFTLPGFNVSQPWSGAEPLDWTIKIAVRANMAEPGSEGPDQKVVTGGMVWIEPPDGLVNGDDYTANEEWNPFSLSFQSRGLYAPDPDAYFTPFFHRDPGDDSPPDGTCKGILPNECIEHIETAAENNYINDRSHPHTIEDEEKCPGISGSTTLDMGSPFRLTKRDWDDGAMEYNEGLLVSFTSALHAQGEAMDYAAHGSQYIPILFRWMREYTKDVEADEPKPDGQIAALMCVAVDKAAEGKELPDPGEEYLESVEGREAGESGSGRFSPELFILVVVGIGMSLFGMA